MPASVTERRRSDYSKPNFISKSFLSPNPLLLAAFATLLPLAVDPVPVSATLYVRNTTSIRNDPIRATLDARGVMIGRCLTVEHSDAPAVFEKLIEVGGSLPDTIRLRMRGGFYPFEYEVGDVFVLAVEDPSPLDSSRIVRKFRPGWFPEFWSWAPDIASGPVRPGKSGERLSLARARIAWWLPRLPEHRQLATIESLLIDPDSPRIPPYPFEAVKRNAHLWSDRIRDRLIQALRSNRRDPDWKAAEILGRHVDDTVRKLFFEFALSDDAEKRALASPLTATDSMSATRELLLALSRDPHRAVRHQVLRVLRIDSSPAEREAAIEIASAPDASGQLRAQFLLRLGRDSTDAIQRLVRESIEACSTQISIREPQHCLDLFTLFWSDRAVRDAVHADLFVVRFAAYREIERRGLRGLGVPLHQRHQSLTGKSDSLAEFELSAVLPALAATGHGRAGGILESHLRHRNPSVRAAAIRGLGRIGDERARGLIKRSAQGPGYLQSDPSWGQAVVDAALLSRHTGMLDELRQWALVWPELRDSTLYAIGRLHGPDVMLEVMRDVKRRADRALIHRFRGVEQRLSSQERTN